MQKNIYLKIKFLSNSTNIENHKFFKSIPFNANRAIFNKKINFQEHSYTHGLLNVAILIMYSMRNYCWMQSKLNVPVHRRFLARLFFAGYFLAPLSNLLFE
ncbi:hypothetical protein BpHYR1_034381 [Brachionus plicatilis]|uniref:Uncharacterized protein n=1 Tax=Brachionus plicatilis TaxID=10195 RepID=A0A3M7SVS0_BRAPC|nr:hypothetical protein BpHYR1_034381 [Brachionus plicatilis]